MSQRVNRGTIVLLALLSFLSASGVGACVDCVADICSMVGGNGFRSCQDIPITRLVCVARTPYEPHTCIEFIEVQVDSFCRPSLGGCVGAH